MRVPSLGFGRLFLSPPAYCTGSLLFFEASLALSGLLQQVRPTVEQPSSRGRRGRGRVPQCSGLCQGRVSAEGCPRRSSLAPGCAEDGRGAGMRG